MNGHDRAERGSPAVPKAARWSGHLPLGGVTFERITVDPDQMGGLPCIRGMRVTVSAVVGQLAAGRTIDDVLGDYPYLEREDVLAALEYAAAAVSERELPLTRPASGSWSTQTSHRA